MEFTQSVSNPMFVGCIELMKAEDTPEHRKMFVAELLKASFLVPSIIDPEPVADEEGNLKITSKSKVQFPMLTAPDGKNFFMGFTDLKEYRKWVEKNGDLPTFALKFDDYVNMILGKKTQENMPSAQGLIINPMGSNVIVSREMFMGVVASRMAQAKHMEAMRSGRPMPGQGVPKTEN